MEFLKSSPDFFTNDVINIQRFMKEKSNVRRQQFSDIWESEKDLPDGWKSRVVNGCNTTKRIFMSVNGTQYYSERKVLEQMIKENYDQTQIKKMQCYMKREGWEANRFLPEGWMIRNGPNGGSFRNMIISSEGDSFHSYLGAVEYMKSIKKYTEKDISLIQDIMNEKVKERNENNEEWIGSKSLPAGWKTRICRGINGKKFFLSPDGIQFPCSRVALQHMIKENYQAKEIK